MYDNNYLYRGISENLYQNTSGKLVPREHTFNLTFKAGGDYDAKNQKYYCIKADGSATAGDSEKNAILGHQMNSFVFKTSGISTTPIVKQAIIYAFYEMPPVGYIHIIDRRLLSKYNVIEYIVENEVEFPNKPEDNEIILRSKDNGILPSDIISATKRIEIILDKNKQLDIEAIYLKYFKIKSI